MGIHGLTKLLCDHAPGCQKENKFDNYFGRKIAVDASMHIYQFMVVVGRQGDSLLTSETGEVTSHLQGMFYRTARMLEAGIKPAYVFDGKPPQLKADQLAERKEKRTGAEESLKAAVEANDAEAIEKFSKRTVKVTKQHNDDCKRLLRLMGVPVIESPSEAEAQCAEMCKSGLVDGMATEDMDALTFGAPLVIRHMMASATAAQPINEFDRAKALAGLKITDDQFIDMCILCGCDYVNNIRGVGPVKALTLIQKHGDIEGVLEHLDLTKYPLPEPFPFKEAREFFKHPEVTPSADIPKLTWKAPNEEELVAFLVHEKQFSEDRVRKAVAKIVGAKGKSSQGRLENFFGPVKVTVNEKKVAAEAAALKAAKAEKAESAKKRKGENTGAAAAKKGKGVGGGSKK
ncbi:MAG: hypothetical protein WDW36_009958 [Sanguina aurantia]